ncbi:MAG: phospholipase D-like domain-containing protein [Acidimicrobiales bacterium]
MPDPHAVPGTAADESSRYRRAVEGLLGVPATEGNTIEVLRNGDEIFPAMIGAIEASQHTIDFLTYVYWSGDVGKQFAAALAARARAGVRVRVLLDAVGTAPMDESLLVDMTAAGALVERFRPVSARHLGKADHRTHRKVLICDEEIGFTGGVGIADEWMGSASNPSEWRDTHFRVRGPAVDGLRAAFVDNWAETTGKLFDEGIDRFPLQPGDGTSCVQVVRGASEAGPSDIATLVHALLQLARRHIRITTAYFVPDPETKDLLCDAARRGVEVELLLPGPHADKRFVQLAGEADYEELLEAGVKAWYFQPTMLHAKIMTIDGIVANVGSANFNARSLSLDEEVNMLVLDRAVVTELNAHFDEDLQRAEPLDLATWRDRGTVQKLAEKAAGLVDTQF